MTQADTFAQALVDLRDLVSDGMDFDAAVVEVAEAYSLRIDAVRSRAMRPGGIFENIAKLGRRRTIEMFMRRYPGEYAVNQSLLQWLEEKSGFELTSDESGFAQHDYDVVLKDRQTRNFKLYRLAVASCKIPRIDGDDDAPNQ